MIRAVTTTVSPAAAKPTAVTTPERGTPAPVPAGERHPGSETPSPWVVAGAGLALAVAVALRLWTRSDLWLDEAQTLDIARLPLSKIGAALREDGSPPLYYLLLHFWVRLVGTSTFAVRALPGLIGIATLPLAWLAGRDLGGRRVAWAATLLTASSPFAIWYSTDNRMYSLLVMEVFAGILLVNSVRRRPRIWNLCALTLTTAALAYTHYWSLFLVATVAVLLVAASVRPANRFAHLCALAAIVAGCATFLPWLPSFLYQLHHTGTPWTTPAGLSVFRDTLLQFSGGLTDEGMGFELVLALLLLLGVFATHASGRRLTLDLATNPRTRALAAVCVGTLLLAIVGGKLAGTGFQDRYASVVFPPLFLVAAAGTLALGSAPVRHALLAGAVALGLFSASYDVSTQRTQAAQIGPAIRAGAVPGDVVGYCPDQLAPDTARLLPSGLVQLTFPRGTGPSMVDWVDYLSAIRQASPQGFAERLLSAAGPTHSIWLVWQTGYRGFGPDCREIADDLIAARSDHIRVVDADPARFAESSRLTEFLP